jgi:hypothetical protein
MCIAAALGLSLSATLFAQPSRDGGRRGPDGQRERGEDRRGGGGNFGPMGMRAGMNPDYMLRDLRRFTEALVLSEDQQVIVEQILRDYDESFREASEASRSAIGDSFRGMRGNEDDPARQQMQESRDRMREIREKLDSIRNLESEQDMQEVRERLDKEMETIHDEMRQQRMEQWQSPDRQAAFEQVGLLMQDQLRIKRQMRDELEGDLQAILTEDQLLLWPPLKQLLVRDRLLPRGRLSGESLDVMGLVEQQGFDDDTLITLLPALDAWGMQVTEALQARDDHMMANQGQLMSAMRTMDVSSGLAVMETQARLAEAVRDTNDSAVDQITQLLPDESSAAFQQEAMQRGYPRIFRPTRGERVLKAAMELDALEPDVLEAIDQLLESYLQEMVVANDSMLRTTRRWEAQEQLDRMNRFAARMTGAGGEQSESPIRQAESDRRETEDRYIEQLRSILTEEQIEAIGALQERRRPDQRRDGGDRRWSRDERGSNDRGGFTERESFMKEFDKNGDGELDDGERQRIRDYFRGGGPQRDGR